MATVYSADTQLNIHRQVSTTSCELVSKTFLKVELNCDLCKGQASKPQSGTGKHCNFYLSLLIVTLSRSEEVTLTLRAALSLIRLISLRGSGTNYLYLYGKWTGHHC